MSGGSQARRAPRTAITGALSAGAHSGSYNGQNAYNARNNVVIANTLGSHHGRNDMDSMGAYITTGTTDRSKNDRSFPVRGGDYTGSVSGTRVDAVSSPTIGVRRLTPTECERLQGFPDGWTADLSDSARYKALGNAVAVPCAEWIGRRIFRTFRLNPTETLGFSGN
jgi:Site-specific DNA methylase